jgi:hypothetical protein
MVTEMGLREKGVWVRQTQTKQVGVVDWGAFTPKAAWLLDLLDADVEITNLPYVCQQEIATRVFAHLSLL